MFGLGKKDKNKNTKKEPKTSHFSSTGSPFDVHTMQDDVAEIESGVTGGEGASPGPDSGNLATSENSQTADANLMGVSEFEQGGTSQVIDVQPMPEEMQLDSNGAQPADSKLEDLTNSIDQQSPFANQVLESNAGSTSVETTEQNDLGQLSDQQIAGDPARGESAQEVSDNPFFTDSVPAEIHADTPLTSTEGDDTQSDSQVSISDEVRNDLGASSSNSSEPKTTYFTANDQLTDQMPQSGKAHTQESVLQEIPGKMPEINASVEEKVAPAPALDTEQFTDNVTPTISEGLNISQNNSASQSSIRQPDPQISTNEISHNPSQDTSPLDATSPFATQEIETKKKKSLFSFFKKSKTDDPSVEIDPSVTSPALDTEVPEISLRDDSATSNVSSEVSDFEKIQANNSGPHIGKNQASKSTGIDVLAEAMNAGAGGAGEIDYINSEITEESTLGSVIKLILTVIFLLVLAACGLIAWYWWNGKTDELPLQNIPYFDELFSDETSQKQQGKESSTQDTPASVKQYSTSLPNTLSIGDSQVAISDLQNHLTKIRQKMIAQQVSVPISFIITDKSGSPLSFRQFSLMLGLDFPQEVFASAGTDFEIYAVDTGDQVNFGIGFAVESKDAMRTAMLASEPRLQQILAPFFSGKQVGDSVRVFNDSLYRDFAIRYTNITQDEKTSIDYTVADNVYITTSRQSHQKILDRFAKDLGGSK